MKNIMLISCFYFAALFANAQSSTAIKEIKEELTAPVALAPLRFLASDELMGRGTMRPEINIAARYINEKFRSFGLKEVPGANDYFQTFEIKMKKPATEGSLTVNRNTYPMVQLLLQLKGGDTAVKAPIVYAKHGTVNDLQNIDVKGKIAITELGENDTSTFMQSFQDMSAKQHLLQEKGAIALIVRYKAEGAISWTGLQHFLTSENATEGEDSPVIPVLLINDEPANLKNLPDSAEATLTVLGTQITRFPAKNVMGYVEGTDAKLKDQYIVLSAHYDHLGVASQPKMEEGKMDSIYNGARDNAIGTTAVIDAAQYFGQHPPKRSVLFIAYTAEEIGEIGSQYFSAHPPVPLKQIVYNLNIDNGGYNNTSIVTVIGLGRTSADDDLKKAATAFNLTAKPDPAPEQDLFDRSDNVNLAVHGIPAPTFSLGFDKVDDDFNKRYHQLSDEVGNFDLNYAIKYIHSFILAAQLIADNPKQPEWTKGDKYEAAWKQLYQ